MAQSTTSPARGRDRELELDRVFGALSHRTRRAMLARLGRGPARVSELAEPFAMSLPAASKHLRVLERAGLVRREIDGRVHRCSFDPAPLEQADAWIRARRSFWEGSLEGLARLVEEEQPTEKRAERGRRRGGAP